MTPLRDAAYVATRLGISVSKLNRECYSGNWPCVDLSPRRWTDEQIEQIIALHVRQPRRVRTAPSVSALPLRVDRRARGPQKRSA
jgi:hypothetical protein